MIRMGRLGDNVRLPARVVLPFGYVVTVRQLTDAEMDSLEDGAATDGQWDVETRTIQIRKSLPLRRKRYILGHELGHALWDWQHECLDLGQMKT